MGLKHSLALLLLDAFNRSDSERPLMLVGRSIEVLVRAVIYDDQVMIYVILCSCQLACIASAYNKNHLGRTRFNFQCQRALFII